MRNLLLALTSGFVAGEIFSFYRGLMTTRKPKLAIDTSVHPLPNDMGEFEPMRLGSRR